MPLLPVIPTLRGNLEDIYKHSTSGGGITGTERPLELLSPTPPSTSLRRYLDPPNPPQTPSQEVLRGPSGFRLNSPGPVDVIPSPYSGVASGGVATLFRWTLNRDTGAMFVLRSNPIQEQQFTGERGQLDVFFFFFLFFFRVVSNACVFLC